MGQIMSRRDKLAGIFGDTSRELAAANFAGEGPSGRILAGPVRTMGLALDRMDQEARELQQALLAGEQVVELDPALVDGSFIRDRLDGEMTEDDDLVKSIERSGQEVPILVRRHPKLDGRYQVAYGHRRLLAVRLLKRKVRAVVKEMTDDQLVVAQGIENSARRDLSYIERATFAAGLENHGFGRDIIMQALSTDKTELSKLLSVAKAVPSTIVKAIGPAPSAGRRRWMEIAHKIHDPMLLDTAEKVIGTPEFQALGSDERFAAVLSEAAAKPKPGSALSEWKPDSGKVAAKIKDNGRTYTLSFKASHGSEGFGAYLTGRLDELYADWKSQQEN
jgi:ParB family chromosome partitioning protein